MIQKSNQESSLTWLLMDERRCDVISMVEASDCRGGVAVSMCSLEAVAVETESLMSKSQTPLTTSYHLTAGWDVTDLSLEHYVRLKVCSCPYKCKCCLRRERRTCGNSVRRLRVFGCGQISPEPLWGWTCSAGTRSPSPDSENTEGDIHVRSDPFKIKVRWHTGENDKAGKSNNMIKSMKPTNQK